MKVVRLGRTIAFYQVFFQQGRVDLGKWCIGPQNGHLRTPFFFCSVPRSHFLGRALLWPGYFGEHVLGLFGLCLSSLSKSVGFVSLSAWESFIGFYICCYTISTILACLFSVGVRISWKTLCWKGAWQRKWHRVSPTLYINVYRVNLNKNFVGALKTTTTNCRVSFIYLYSVFPRNFKIVFLPHTNTVNLLEPPLWYYHRTWETCDLFSATGHNINWDQFKILASGKTDHHCKIKETLFIQKPAFDVNISSEKLMLY